MGSPYILIALFLAGLGVGWQGNDYRRDALELAAIKDAEKITVQLATTSRKLEVAHAANKVLREKKERVITKEVIKYQASDCPTTREWVHIYNCSVSKDTRGTCGTIDPTTRAVPDSVSLEVAALNNQLCLKQFDTLKTLQAILGDK